MLSLVTIATLVTTVNVELVSSRFISPMHGRIIGGENTTIEDHPHQVSIQYDGEHECGGSIISKNWVLTAAHCIIPSMAKNITIRAGTSFRNRGGSMHKLGIFRLHEGYEWTRNGTLENDIAVFKVKPAFIFGKTRQPIELFEDNEPAKAGAPSVVIGWGVTDDSELYPVQLQKLSVPIINKSVCNKAYKKLVGGLPVGQICAGFMGLGGKSSCTGDSGGPLTINGRLAGIVSWGHDCADPKYPAVYSEVAYYRDWIRNATNI